jgi:hypothetical protein
MRLLTGSALYAIRTTEDLSNTLASMARESFQDAMSRIEPGANRPTGRSRRYMMQTDAPMTINIHQHRH